MQPNNSKRTGKNWFILVLRRNFKRQLLDLYSVSLQ